MSLNLLVETTLLNSIISPDNWVYVKVGPEYVRKKGRDLNEGDVVVVKNEGISKTLEEIEPVLEESLRYKLARDGIHRQDSHNQYVPLLRTLLLEGLAVQDQSLEEKLRSGNSLSDEEYTQLSQKIAPSVTVTASAVNKWLTGETLAPADWDNFQRLTVINPLFEGIYHSRDQDVGFHADYSLYVGARRTIMSHLAKRKGEKEGSPNRPRKDPKNKFTEEIELVVSYFMEEIDDSHDAARITRITTMSTPKGSDRAEAPNPHLSKGIATDFAVDVMDMNKVISARYLLGNALMDGIAKYSKGRIPIEDSIIAVDYLNRFDALSPSFFEVVPDHLKEAAAIVALAPRYFVQRFSPRSLDIIYDAEVVKKVTRLSEKEITDVLEREYLSFERALREGEVDKKLLTDHGTVATLIDQFRQYDQAVPRVLHEFENTLGRIRYLTKLSRGKIPQQALDRAEKQKNEAIVRTKGMTQYLAQTYGVYGGQQKVLYFEFIASQVSLQSHAEEKIRGLLTPEYQRQIEVEKKMKFYTRGEVKTFFAELGIPSAARMVEKLNFV